MEEVRFKNDTANLPKLRAFISKIVDSCKANDKFKNKIILAVDEAVSNIIEHAYAEIGEGEAEIKVQVCVDPERLIIIIKDTGISFDPSEVETPDIHRHIQEGRKNGLGIFLMRQIMDEVRYSFKSGVENELTLVKYFRD
jgi:serine/threonine-protein kinase RsbW